MKKIEQVVSEAFNQGYAAKQENTSILVKDGVVSMKLHNSVIAMKHGNILTLDMCGYNTRITRSRLNLIEGLNICQRAGKLYITAPMYGVMCMEWNGNLINLKKAVL